MESLFFPSIYISILSSFAASAIQINKASIPEAVHSLGMRYVPMLYAVHYTLLASKNAQSNNNNNNNNIHTPLEPFCHVELLSYMSRKNKNLTCDRNPPLLTLIKPSNSVIRRRLYGEMIAKSTPELCHESLFELISSLHLHPYLHS